MESYLMDWSWYTTKKDSVFKDSFHNKLLVQQKLTSTQVDQWLDFKVLLITHTTDVGLYFLPWNLESSRSNMFHAIRVLKPLKGLNF